MKSPHKSQPKAKALTKAVRKGAKVTARKVWFDRGYTSKQEMGACAFLKKPGKDVFTYPVFVLPATPEAYDAMVEHAHGAIVARYGKYSTDECVIVDALASLGINSPAHEAHH